MAAAAKASVSEYRISRATWPNNNTSAGVTNGTSQYVRSVVVTNSTISITFSTNASTDIAGDVLVFKGTYDGNGVKWACDTAANTIESKFLPANCRP